VTAGSITRPVPHLLIVLAACGTARAQTAVSTFDNHNEEWEVVHIEPTVHTGGAAPMGWAPWSPLGTPAGSLRVGDVAPWTWIQAPPPFRGEFFGAYGGVLAWDLFIRNADPGAIYPTAAIVGVENTLYARINNNQLQLNHWNSLSYPLLPGPWRLNSYGSETFATEQEIRDVLNDVQGVYLTTEYATGNDDTNIDNVVFGQEPAGCRPDLTTGAIAGQPGYGVPNGVLNNDDFFYYLAQFAGGNPAVADVTTGAIAGQPGYGIPNGIINNDDFFYYLAIFAAGC
jgi:hypothetical protein